jgi:hypothetical protein
MNIYIILNWIMLLGLIPLSIFWIRNAWKVAVKKDLSYVALKRGTVPNNPKKYASYYVALNLISGLILATVFLLVFIAGLEYGIWTSIVGPTIWMKVIADFILRRHAHTNRK